MKTINLILSALFLFLSIGQLWSQEKMPYKSKAMFKADTLQYLEYNYNVERSVEYYKDKTVSDILKELEYPVLYIVESFFLTMPNGSSKLTGLSLGIQQNGAKPNPLDDYYVTVRFKNPPTTAEYREVTGVSMDNHNPVFSSKIYEFIKDLKVSHVASNPYIITKRKNLEAKRALEEIEKQKSNK